MDIPPFLGQLLGVIVGAVIAGGGALYRARTERRRQIGRALTDLLEVRHHLLGIELMISELGKRFELPSEIFPLMRNALETIIPIEAKLHERYEEAVSLLAGVDPFFAFQLRSKTILPRALSAMRAFSTQGGGSLTSMELLEQQLTSLIIPTLNQTAVALARRHSVMAWWRVRRLVSTSATLPPEVEPLLQRAQALAAGESTNEKAAG